MPLYQIHVSGQRESFAAPFYAASVSIYTTKEAAEAASKDFVARCANPENPFSLDPEQPYRVHFIEVTIVPSAKAPENEAREPIVHELKCWMPFFQCVMEGAKSFEIRREDDRDFRVGDTLHLKEWDQKAERYTERWVSRRVTYVTRAPAWGLPEGVAVLSLR